MSILDNIQPCLPEGWRILDIYSFVEKSFILSSSAALTAVGIAGYSFYLGFMKENPNTLKRLINVLNGQFAILEQLYALAVFASVVRDQFGYGDDYLFNDIMVQARSFLGFCTVLVQFHIAVTTLMKKFYPGLYLEWSEKWTLKKSLRDLGIILLLQGLLFCSLHYGALDSEAYTMVVAFFTLTCFVLLCLSLLIQLRIVFAENEKEIQLNLNQMFKSNSVGPNVEAQEEANGEHIEESEEEVSHP